MTSLWSKSMSFSNFVEKYVRLQSKKLILLQRSFLNMSEYAWTCLNKHNSECASGPKYAKILNMTKLWTWRGYQYASVTQPTEFVRICLGRVLNISWVLNMPGFWILQSSEYARELHRTLNMLQHDSIYLHRTWICLIMSEFTIIDWVLNMYYTIQSARLLYNLTL